MNKTGKHILTAFIVVLAVSALLVISFRSPPQQVDVSMVVESAFRITIEEEGRTRLADRYLVSAPVAAHLNRVFLEPGDRVHQGDTLFTLHPLPADPLDARSRAQAEATVARSEAALEVARARVEAEEVAVQLAEDELARIRPLAEQGLVALETRDRAEAMVRSANASLRSARFAVDVARHEVENARAALSIAGGEGLQSALEITSPINGQILSRLRQSEGRVQPGEAILILGDLSGLQVEVDVLSPDAVRLEPGMKVELERWGGGETLMGRVLRIEPAGFTRVSALGVEEQRVWVIVGFDAPRERWERLGDGYRIEARFILRESDEVLQAPASALFREDDRWYAFVVENDRAVRREVVPGERSGLVREILDGLEPGERVITHPGEDIADDVRIRVR